MDDPNYRVPPLSRLSIERVAERLRSIMGVNMGPLPVPELLEVVFPKLFPEYTWEVVEKSELGSMHGAVDPANKLLKIREDVYEGMIAGRGRDRFTVVHEIGHVILHGEVVLARTRDRPKAYECPEWQANAFAGSMLMPEREVRQIASATLVAKTFGVSEDAARYRIRKLGAHRTRT